MAKVHSKVDVPPHLRLGLICRAYIKFIDFELIKVGFMNNCTSIRSKYPPGLSWIAEQYGDRLTGYDMVNYGSIRNAHRGHAKFRCTT